MPTITTDNESLGLYTDFYELSMAQGYFFAGKKDEHAVFDYFFRTNPFEGGFVVFAGLADLLQSILSFKYSDENIDYLSDKGFRKEFLQYLGNVRFKGRIYSVKEGEIVFPNETIVRIEGNIIETQLIETMLLNILNFQSLIATKAFRVGLAAKEKPFTDFGLRRAQGAGGIQASRAAIIGGASGTSNVFSGFLYDLPVMGTMAHSWIQSFEDELTAFRKYAEINPDSTILLVDTYHTLRSGVPNAITVAKELKAKGHHLVGIRLDSGDLAYLSKKSRKMLDEAGLRDVKIFVSNQLNEYVISSLEDQEAPIDGFGIGTELVTGHPDAALDGVYKLSECNGQPRMKISENIEKVTLPGKKLLYRYYDTDGNFLRDGILLENENADRCSRIYHAFHPEKWTEVSHLRRELIQEIVFDKGEITCTLPSPLKIHEYLTSRAAQLPDEHKRFIMPHIYKVGISKSLMELRDELRRKLDREIDQNNVV
jgi:nicotinate phosphoribosyltransferase